jgi:hypothetical protein
MHSSIRIIDGFLGVYKTCLAVKHSVHRFFTFRKAELISELKAIGFHIDFDQESKGLSVVKEDDPVLIRIHARKPEKKLERNSNT